MLQTTFLLMIIFLIALMLSVAFGFLHYKIKRKTFDFYMMFLIGIVWVVLGFLFKIWFLTIIGAVFFLIGLLKRSQWDEDLENINRAHREEIYSIRNQTSSTEKLFGWIIFIGILILAGVIAYIILK
jgi:Ca2+/Na+ antiporter